MLTQENLIVFLYALPVYQLLFFTVQLITFRRAYPSRRSLGLLLLNMTIVLILNAVPYMGYARLMITLHLFFIPFLLSLLPVFFLYLYSLINEDREVSGLSRYSLFIFPVMALLLDIFTFGMLPAEERLMIVTGQPISGGTMRGSFQVAEWMYQWMGAILFALQLAFAFRKVRAMIHSEKLAVRNDPGHTAYLQPAWLQVIAVSLILFIVVILLPFILHVRNPLATGILSNVILLACGGLAGFYGMKQDSILVQVSSLGRAMPLSRSAQDPAIEKRIGRGTSEQAGNVPMISPEKAQKIVGRLDTLMTEQKPYLDANYSMNDLCVQLDIPRRYMTYVLNDVMGKNFYGVVNEYRMKEAIRIIEDSGRKYTIEAIAEMVGFNSKSSFYACFRKYTGSSPKEFFEGR